MGRLTPREIDLDALRRRVASPGCGAVACFVGTVREANRGREVIHIDYSAYERMAEKVMEEIESDLGRRFPGIRVAIRHRTGRVRVGQASVAVVVAAEHRREALRACSEAIEALKARVPIWKKECYRDGSAWIDNRDGAGSGAEDPGAPADPA